MLGFTPLASQPLSSYISKISFAGTTNFVFDSIADLSGEGKLLGGLNFSFIPSGTLYGIFPTFGVSTLTFDTIGLLSGEGKLFGELDFSFSLSGKITKTLFGNSYGLSISPIYNTSTGSSGTIYELSSGASSQLIYNNSSS